MKIDKTDLRIVDLLKKNGRISNNEIAAKLSVSEGTVRNRIKKLNQERYLWVHGQVNPAHVKPKQIIYIGVKVAVSKDLERTAQAVVKMSGVCSVSIVPGRYDLLVEVLMEPFNVIHFINRDLAKVGSVVSTETFMTLKTYNKWV